MTLVATPVPSSSTNTRSAPVTMETLFDIDIHFPSQYDFDTEIQVACRAIVRAFEETILYPISRHNSRSNGGKRSCLFISLMSNRFTS